MVSYGRLASDAQTPNMDCDAKLRRKLLTAARSALGRDDLVLIPSLKEFWIESKDGSGQWFVVTPSKKTGGEFRFERTR